MTKSEVLEMLRNRLREAERSKNTAIERIPVAPDKLDDLLKDLRAQAELFQRGYKLMGASDISEYLALCGSVRKNIDRIELLESAIETAIANNENRIERNKADILENEKRIEQIHRDRLANKMAISEVENEMRIAIRERDEAKARLVILKALKPKSRIGEC